MKKEDKRSLYLWGIIAGLWIFVLFVIEEKMGYLYNTQAKSIFFGFQSLGLGVAIYMALRNHKANNENMISFGRCVFNSILISAMSGIVVSIFTFIYFSAMPDVKESMINKSELVLSQEQHKDSKTIAEYRIWITDSINNAQSTLEEKSKDKMEADSTIKVMEERMTRTKSLLTLSGLILTYTPNFILIGLIIAIFIAAVIANKKPQ